MHLLDLGLKLNTLSSQALSFCHSGLSGFLLLLCFVSLVLDGVHRVLHSLRLLIKLDLRACPCLHRRMYRAQMRFAGAQLRLLFLILQS